VAIAATTGAGRSPESYVYVLNADGSVVAGRFNQPEEWVGWFPWDGVGAVRYLAADQADLLATVQYGSASAVEAFDEAQELDCAMTLGTDDLAEFAGLRVDVIKGGMYRGDYLVSPDGSLEAWLEGNDGAMAGFAFRSRVIPLVGNVEGGESSGQRLRLRSIGQAAVTLNTTSSELRFCGRTHAAYRALDDQGGAPPPRNKTIRGRVRSRAEDPEILLERDHPGRLTIIEFATEVSV
jgi:hypothetical protein